MRARQSAIDLHDLFPYAPKNFLRLRSVENPVDLLREEIRDAWNWVESLRQEMDTLQEVPEPIDGVTPWRLSNIDEHPKITTGCWYCIGGTLIGKSKESGQPLSLVYHLSQEIIVRQAQYRDDFQRTFSIAAKNFRELAAKKPRVHIIAGGGWETTKANLYGIGEASTGEIYQGLIEIVTKPISNELDLDAIVAKGPKKAERRRKRTRWYGVDMQDPTTSDQEKFAKICAAIQRKEPEAEEFDSPEQRPMGSTGLLVDTPRNEVTIIQDPQDGSIPGYMSGQLRATSSTWPKDE